MLGTQDFAQLKGATLMGRGGKIGKVDELYADRESGEPSFATVKTGLMGGSHFVPLQDADLRDGDVYVPYDEQLVKDAPKIADDAELSPEEEDRLYTHYSMSGGTSETTTTGYAAGDRDGDGVSDDVERTAVGRDTSGPTTDDAMTLSEERLRVGTQKTETGRARLRKYITTEQVSESVPVTREEVRLEREPITDANRDRATSGPELSEEEHEVTLHEERAVVDKEVVPTERVRLDKETVTENVTVNEEVRREQVDVDGVEDARTETELRR